MENLFDVKLCGDLNGRSWPGVSYYVEPRHVFFVWVDRNLALRLVGSNLSRSFASALWLVRRVQLHLHPSPKPKISCRIQAILGSPVGWDKPWQVWAFMDFRHEALDLPEESGKQGTEVETSEVLFFGCTNQ